MGNNASADICYGFTVKNKKMNDYLAQNGLDEVADRIHKNVDVTFHGDCCTENGTTIICIEKSMIGCSDWDKPKSIKMDYFCLIDGTPECEEVKSWDGLLENAINVLNEELKTKVKFTGGKWLLCCSYG